MADLSKTLEIVFKGTDSGVSSLAGGITGKISGLNAALGDIAEPLNKLANGVLATESALIALGAAFVSVSLFKAGEFGNKLNEIGTIAGTSKENVAQFGEDILTYGTKSNKSIADINESVYQAISAGIDYKDSLAMLKVSEDLAVGGRAQLSDTTNVLIGSMNAYGVSNKDAGAQLKIAGDYADAMFVAVQKGVTTVPELSQQLGDVTSSAAAAGISFDTLLAAIAAVTASGIPTAQAVTSINQAIQNIIKPSSQAADMAKELGLAFDAQSLKDQGLPTFLRNVQTATGGSIEKLSILFGSVEALKSVLVLGADKAGVFADSLKAMDDRAGKSAEAAAMMANSWENASQRLQNAADGAFITFGKKIEQEAGKGLNGIADVFNAFTVSLRAGAFDPVFDYLNAAGADLNKAMADIAKNLPEALSNIDFGGLLGSFDGLGDSLKTAFEDVFGKVDLSTPEGVQAVIQEVINGIQTLTEITTGIVDSFRPYALALGDIIQRTEGLGTESNKQIGNVLGIAKAFTDFGGAVTAVGLVLGDDKNSINRFFTGFIGLSESLVESIGVTIDYIKLFMAQVDLIELKTQFFNPFGDGAEKTASDIKAAEENIAKLNQSIDAHWERSAEGFRKFGGAVTGSTEEAKDGVDRLTESTDKAVESTQKFEPIDLGNIDFIEEAAKRLGFTIGYDAEKTGDLNTQINFVAESMHHLDDATWLAKNTTADYRAEVERVALPDGAVKITDSLGNISIVTKQAKDETIKLTDSVGGAATVMGTFSVINGKNKDAIKEHTTEMEKAQKAADDYALKLTEASNKVKIAGLEQWGKINVAQIESDTKKVEAMFKSIDNTVSVTGKTIGDLWGQMSKVSDWDKTALQDSIRKQEQSQQDALSKQNELIDAQIALLKARTEKMQSGDALIRVEATGLKPHLERIFGEILKETQLKASEQGVNLLLGFGS